MNIKEFSEFSLITIGDLIEINGTFGMQMKDALPKMRCIRDRLQLTDKDVLKLALLVKQLNSD